jgi:hypothetical protein
VKNAFQASLGGINKKTPAHLADRVQLYANYYDSSVAKDK